ncbi:hypothetical protein [Candidatus Poriferisodalis sp.]
MAARLCALERAHVEAMRAAGASVDDIAGKLGRGFDLSDCSCDADGECR